jgi:hypothetical protein
MRATAFLLCLTPFLHADEMASLRASLAKLERGTPDFEEIKQGSALDGFVMRMAASNTPWRAKYLAAEWLLRAHVARARQADVKASRADLEKGWLLIDSAIHDSKQIVVGETGLLYRGADAQRRQAAATALSDAIQPQEVPKDLAKALLATSIETAVRLGDPIKMSKALAPILEGKIQLADRPKTYAWMAAAHSGQWSAFRVWSDELKAQGKILPAIHQGAVNDAEAIDYSALAEAGDKLHLETPKELPSSRSIVKELRLKLREVRAKDAATSSQVLANFPKDWQKVGPLDASLMRSGAIAHWQKPARTPIPMSGSWSADQLNLFGYVEATHGRRTELLQAKPDPARPGTWIGTLSTEQGSGSDALTLILDLELDLQPQQP